MKKQKGVTLISLTIYVIAITVVIAMLSVTSTYFYKNVNETQDDITPLTELTNFNTYFSTDANTSNVTYLTTGESGETDENYYTYVALVNEDSLEIIKYVYVKKDKAIYRDTGTEENGDKTTITVARNVTDCEFEESTQENNDKTKFIIRLTVGNNNKEYTYNLNND